MDIASKLLDPVSEFVSDSEQIERSPQQEVLSKEFITVARQVRQNVRDIARLLKAVPELDHLLRKITAVSGDAGEEEDQQQASHQRFIAVLDQLKVQVRRNLATSVEEDKAEREHYEVVAQREKKLAQEAKSLSKDLASIQHERHRAVAVKDDQLNAYNSELQELKDLTTKAAASGGRSSEANEATVKAFNETKANLVKEVKRREAELERLKIENREKEEQLSKRSFKKETDVESWITRYDQEMSDLNVEYMATRVAYNDEKARLRELDDYFERFRLEEGGARFLTLCDLADEGEARARQDRFDSNAIKVQAAIRGHLLRKELIEKAKKKGKGGKKGGKGKKK